MDRKVPLYKLYKYKYILERLESFERPPESCNFKPYNGWGGGTYVSSRGEDNKPTWRAADLLNIYGLKLTDYVVLTEDQYKDYEAILQELV